MSKKTHEMFIGGNWVTSSSGETIEDINPATGEAIADIQRATKDDVDVAVAAGLEAYNEVWFDTPPKERSAMMLALAEKMENDADELARLESVDVGKPISASKEDIPFIIDNLRFFAGSADDLERRHRCLLLGDSDSRMGGRECQSWGGRSVLTSE